MYHEIDIKNISSGISPGFPGSTSGKEPGLPTGNARDVGLIPGSERPSRGGHGKPLQYSSLENPTDRRAWWAAVHRVAKLDMTEHTHTHTHTHTHRNRTTCEW